MALTSLLASVSAPCRQVRFCSRPGFDTIVSKTSALGSSALPLGAAARRLKMNPADDNRHGGAASLSDGDRNGAAPPACSELASSGPKKSGWWVGEV